MTETGNRTKFSNDFSEKSAMVSRPSVDGAAPASSQNSSKGESQKTHSSSRSRTSLDDAQTEDDFYLRAKNCISASELTESSHLPPDITLFCQRCKRYIDISDLRDHGNLHEALRLFQYKDSEQPKNLAALNTRRKALVKDTLRNAGKWGEVPDVGRLEVLDMAFERIKNELENNERRVHAVNVPEVCGVSLKCVSTSGIRAVGMCASTNRKWRHEMDETRMFQDCFGGDPSRCFFGIYSGYNGANAAETSAKELHRILLSEMETFDKQLQPQKKELGEERTNTNYPHSCLREDDRSFKPSCDSFCSKVNSANNSIPDSEATAHVPNSCHVNGQDVRCEESGDDFAKKMSDAFVVAHNRVDEILLSGKGENSRVRWSGCSTLTCLIQAHEATELLVEPASKTETSEKGLKDLLNSPHSETLDQTGGRNDTPGQQKYLATLHLANAGDARAVLIRRNKPIELSTEHTPANPREHHRITKLGGAISEGHKELRVNGVVATTRGLGNHGNPLIKKCVISRPFTASVPIDEFCQVLILASKGVWQVLGEEDVTVLLLEMLPGHFIPPPSVISSAIDELLQGRTRKPGQESSNDVSKDASSAATTNSYSKSDLSSRNGKENKISNALHENSSSRSQNYQTMGNTAAERNFLTAQQDNVKYTDSDNGMSSEDHRDFVGDIERFSSGTEASDGSGNVNGMILVEDESLRLSRVMAERLVQAALMAGSKDNITAMIILFSGSNSDL